MLRGSDKRLFLGTPLSSAFATGRLARIGRLSSPPFRPDIAWYDPTLDLVGLGFGQPLNYLMDLSGNGNDLGGPGNTGISVDSINGRRAIGFSAVSTNQMASLANISDALAKSAFVVASVNTVGSGSRTMLGANGGGGFQLRTSAATLQLLRQGTAAKASLGAASVSANTPFVAGAVVDAAGATLYLNTTGETDADTTAFTSRTLIVGNRDTGAESWTGQIGEIMLFNSTLTSTDALAVIAYLMGKWGIS